MPLGLTCKGLVRPTSEQKFTGLIFNQCSGKISLSKERMRRIRLSLLYTAEKGFATGDEMRALLRHCNWGACYAANSFQYSRSLTA